MVSDNELNKLRTNNGNGTLKKMLYNNPVGVGEVISLQSERETVQAKVVAVPEGLAAKDKSTLIEVELILSGQK